MKKEIATKTDKESESSLEKKWESVKTLLRKEVGEFNYNQWLSNLQLGHLEGDELILYSPNRFLRDRVKQGYSDLIEALWKQCAPSIERIEIHLLAHKSEKTKSMSSDTSQNTEEVQQSKKSVPSQLKEKKKTFSASFHDQYTFDNFIVGKPNEFAYAAARRVSEQPSSEGFNPLFLYGGVGLGKTHLMHAIGLELQKKNNLSVSYMTAEKFVHQFVSSLKSKTTVVFQDEVRSVDILMIDDVQFFMGKEQTQEAFFHTFNEMINEGKQIILTADKTPSELDSLDPRLRSRLGSGMVADIHATTYELRLAILEDRVEHAQKSIPQSVLQFLAHNIATNVRELVGALNRLLAQVELFGGEIDLDKAQYLLKDILKSTEKHITIKEIKNHVSEYFNIPAREMVSKRRTIAYARPRQVAMFLSKELTNSSYPEIGRQFGGRDHTTVMHAVKRITAEMKKDSSFNESVLFIKKMLET